MKKFGGCTALLKNAGYHEDVYRKYNSEITLQNNRMNIVTSFIGSIIMTLLSVASFFLESVSKAQVLYLITAILFIIVHLLARKTGQKNNTAALLYNYVFLTIAFFFAIGLDVIQNSITATTVCVLLVALPLLIVDRPYREFIYFIIMLGSFIVETVFIKQSPKSSIDVINGISFFVVGVFLGYKHNQMVIRNIINQRLLENQRDLDTLTTLYNKGAMENKAVEFLSRTDVTASIMVIDMDNFKYVNDTYGHQVGDEILLKVGKMLLSLFRKSDLISRFGGDEFIVFLPMTDNVDNLKMKAEQILKEIKNIRIDADPDYRSQICIGIAVYPNNGGSYEELFSNADAAMYKVKKNGKNGYGFYNDGDIEL